MPTTADAPTLPAPSDARLDWPAPPELPPRESIPKSANLCESCTAKCCQYFALPIETPETREEFDNLRWYMYHGGPTDPANPARGQVQVFVDDDTWFLMVNQPCRHLQPDNRCGVYDIRPQICRNYTTKSCEYDGDGLYDLFFETPEQLHEYAIAMLPPEPRPAIDPLELPILVG